MLQKWIIQQCCSNTSQSGNGGADNTGGGIIQVNTPNPGATFAAAAIKVNLTPASAVSSGAQWKLGSAGTLRANGVQLNSLSPGNYTLYFIAAAGFLTPPSQPVTLMGGTLATFTRTYFGVTTQPQDRTVNAFGNATFSVAVSGSPNHYQWRRNGALIANANAASYTVAEVSLDDAASYLVVVTWPEGTGFVSQASNAATLTVNRLSQTIAFPAPSNRRLGDPPLTLSASTDSGLSVVFSLDSGPATLSGGIITPAGFGTIQVRAKQLGDTYYAAAATIVRTFQVTGDTLDSWRARNFTAAELGNAQVSGPLADFEGDGLNNLLEFALNLNPKTSDRATMVAGTGTGGLPLIRSESVSGQPRVTTEFVRRRAVGAPGISYTMEFSSDLTTPTAWSSAGGTETTTQIDDTWERVKVTDSQPASPSRYARLKVTMP